MSTPKSGFRGGGGSGAGASHQPDAGSSAPFDTPSGAFAGAPPPTHAAFSPANPLSITSDKASRASKRRSTILVHQKSPLLLATPPQITRALAYSHPFLLPLNKLAGLLSWTTDDPWESFLVVAGFWAVVLYGDFLTRVAAPILAVAGLILGMYGRRFSPLSSSGWTEPAAKDGANGPADAKGQKPGSGGKPAAAGRDGPGHQRTQSVEATNTRHQKTLDEIVETLKEFTARCNILLEPLLELTDFLSTQRTPTSATTRPALMTLLVRILLCTPFWVALTLPPLRIVTTRRIVLVLGTLILTWHARVMRVVREILWRSASVRRLAALTTGLAFDGTAKKVPHPAIPTIDLDTSAESAAAAATKKVASIRHAIGSGKDAGVKFTFIIYQNQRRWVMLGWTSNMLAYERAAWTDEHNNVVPSKDEFELPEVEDGHMRWRWVPGSRWRVDGVPVEEGVEVDYDGEGGKIGWIFYDNKWQNGRRGIDGWGKWTRRRKWYRDAELVEVDEEEEQQYQQQIQPHDPDAFPADGHADHGEKPSTASAAFASLSELAERDAAARADRERAAAVDDSASVLSSSSRSFFRAPLRRKATDKSGGGKRAPSTESTSRSSRTGAGIAGADGTGVREPSEGDDDSGLGFEVERELQGQGREGGKWGIGDEARMGLE